MKINCESGFYELGNRGADYQYTTPLKNIQKKHEKVAGFASLMNLLSLL